MKRLWACPKCRRRFANLNQTHSCGPLDLEHHFAGKSPKVLEIYYAFLSHVKAIGPVIVLPEKTRIAFQVRMSFAQLTPRRESMNGHLVLARRVEDPRFRKVDTMSPRSHVHHFRLNDALDIDEPFLVFLREAYAVGKQEHLRSEKMAR